MTLGMRETAVSVTHPPEGNPDIPSKTLSVPRGFDSACNRKRCGCRCHKPTADPAWRYPFPPAPLARPVSGPICFRAPSPGFNSPRVEALSRSNAEVEDSR